MTDNNFHNPLLDDDDDELTTPLPVKKLNLPSRPNSPIAPSRPTVKAPVTPVENAVEEKVTHTLTTTREPQFGEKGYRKGIPNPHKGTPRSRITQNDLPYLLFAGMFPGADVEAMSLLRHTQKSPVSEGGKLRTIKGTLIRLKKLEELGALESYKSEITGTTHWGLTEGGYLYAQYSDVLSENKLTIGLSGMSLTRLNHYRMIALAAAKFVSPEGFFQQSLGMAPVDLLDLVSEPEMRREQLPIKDELAAVAKQQGTKADFGKWRINAIKESLKDIKDGHLGWHEIAALRPELWTIGQPYNEALPVKSTHWADFVVDRSRLQKDRNGQSLLIEVELSKKSWKEYERILRTFFKEFQNPLIYQRVVYFTVSNEVETMLRRVDEKHEFGLFASKRLVVLPLTHRDGTPVKLKTRIGD